jgi:hypothetical protein
MARQENDHSFCGRFFSLFAVFMPCVVLCLVLFSWDLPFFRFCRFPAFKKGKNGKKCYT